MRYLYQEAIRHGDTYCGRRPCTRTSTFRVKARPDSFIPLHQLLYRLLPLGSAFDLELIVNYRWRFAGMAGFSATAVQRHRGAVRRDALRLQRL